MLLIYPMSYLLQDGYMCTWPLGSLAYSPQAWGSCARAPWQVEVITQVPSYELQQAPLVGAAVGSV